MIFVKSSHNSAVLVFLLCIHVALGQVSTDRVWKTNCFKETDSGRCEDSWIKISSSYYLCDLVIAAEAPPKRIGYVNGNILAAVQSQTFVVHNGTLQLMNANILIPPRNEFVDKKDNRYYAADGSTYMAESKTKKEIEILTTGEYSVNQLAFDRESNQLLILSFSAQSETNERAGSLFAINTETINLENDTVQAKKVDGAGNRITAMAVEGDLEKLLLGMRTPQGGKLIGLTKQKGNPCVESAFDKTTLVGIVNETQEKLLKYFENVASKPINADVLPKKSEGLSTRALELENIQLKRNLLVATTKLNAFNSKLTSYNKHLKSVQTSSAGEYSGSIGQAAAYGASSSGGAGYGASASGGAGYGGSSFASPVRSGGYGGGTFGYTQGGSCYMGSPYSNTEGSAGYGGSPYGNIGGVVGYGGNAFGNIQGSIGYMGSPFGGLRDGAYFRGGVPGGTWGGSSHSDLALDGTWRDTGYANSPFGGSRGCVSCGGGIPGSTWGGPPYGPWVRNDYGNYAFGSPVGVGGYSGGVFGVSQGSTGYGDSPCSHTGGCAGYRNSPYIGSVENGGNTFGGIHNGAGYRSPYTSPIRSGSHGINAFGGIQGGFGYVGSRCGHTGGCAGYGSSTIGGTQGGAVTGGNIAEITGGGVDDTIIEDEGSGSGHDDSVVRNTGEGAGYGSSAAGITEGRVGLGDGEKSNGSSVLGNIEESADYGESTEGITQGDHDLSYGGSGGYGGNMFGGIQGGTLSRSGISGIIKQSVGDKAIGVAGSDASHGGSVTGSSGGEASYKSSSARITEGNVGLNDGASSYSSSVIENTEGGAEGIAQGSLHLSNSLTKGTGGGLAASVTNTISDYIQRSEKGEQKTMLSNVESEVEPEIIFPDRVLIDLFNKLSCKTEEAKITNQKLMRELEASSLNVESLFNDTTLPVAPRAATI